MRARNPRALPLYAQVKELLIRDVVDGRWKAGEMLPSEFELADEFGVSQGTVRKALDALSDENVVVRRQGRGTFLAESTPQHSLFHFFHIATSDGSRVAPESLTLSIDTLPADEVLAARLGLRPGDGVIRIRRVRSLQNRPALLERIYLSQALFAGLEAENTLPDALYNLYERGFGVTIHRAEDQIRARSADAEDAEILELAPGTPLLEVSRSAYTLDGRVAEFRVSHCCTAHCHYFVNLN